MKTITTSYKIKDIPCPDCGTPRVCVNGVKLQCNNCGNFTLLKEETTTVTPEYDYITVDSSQLETDATVNK